MARSAEKIKRFTVKFTPEQHKAISARAERCGLRVSSWVRSILVQAATRPAKDGHLRIKEPDGVFS